MAAAERGGAAGDATVAGGRRGGWGGLPAIYTEIPGIFEFYKQVLRKGRFGKLLRQKSCGGWHRLAPGRPASHRETWRPPIGAGETGTVARDGGVRDRILAVGSSGSDGPQWATQAEKIGRAHV